jgi:hypothetical protein
MAHEQMPDVFAPLEHRRQSLPVAQANHIHPLQTHRKGMMVDKKIDRTVADTVELVGQPAGAPFAE